MKASEIVVWRLTSSQSAPDKDGAPAPSFVFIDAENPIF
jgi:hypothetical protein